MRIKLNPKIINWLEENVPGRPWKETFRMFKQEFPDLEWSLDSMKHSCYRHGIRNEIDSRYKKGNKSWCAGMKGLRIPGSEKGWFKEGRRPPNERPLGSEREYGKYTLVKVKRDGGKYEKWKPKQVHIWEQHNGPLPKGYIITFIDGDKSNLNINNLACIKKSVNGAMNIKSLRSESPELFKVRVAQIELDQKIKRITKNLGSD